LSELAASSSSALPPEAICILEKKDGLHSDSPSAEVIGKLLNDFSEQRRSVTRQRWLQGVMALLVCLVALALWQTWRVRREMTRNVAALRVVFILHFLSDLSPLLERFEKLGMDPKKTSLIRKPYAYPSAAKITAELSHKGYPINFILGDGIAKAVIDPILTE